MSKLAVIIIIIIIIITGAYVWIGRPEIIIKEGSRNCAVDEDCVVFGKTGDCNCGCYNKNNLPIGISGRCSCAAPKSCKCINGKCEPVFDKTVNWKIYKNNNLNLTFRYPLEYEIKDGIDIGVTGLANGWISLSKDRKSLMEIWPARDTSETEEKTFEEFSEQKSVSYYLADGVTGSQRAEISSVSPITINNLNGFEIFIKLIIEKYISNPPYTEVVSNRERGPIYILDISSYTDKARALSFIPREEELESEYKEIIKDLIATIRIDGSI